MNDNALPARVWRKLLTTYHRRRYMAVAERVLQTAPLARGSTPLTVLSMVQKRDVLPYLMAVKSFAAHLAPERVIVVCDPSIDGEDRATLTRHIPHLELFKAEAFRSSEYPVGGTWERLAAITQVARESYVTQLDADTLTCAPLPEVAEAIASGHGFVIGEQENQPIMTLEQTELNARAWNERHIQSLSEKNIAHAGLPLPNYVRGCSGFTGFPRSDDLRERMVDFSARMAAITRGRWAEWGTEQITSNYLVANARGTRVLPYPRYSTPTERIDEVAFFHFIGFVRFVNPLYRQKTAAVLRTLPGPRGA